VQQISAADKDGRDFLDIAGIVGFQQGDLPAVGDICGDTECADPRHADARPRQLSERFTIIGFDIAAHAQRITGMLVTYGVGLTLGNWLGGKLADRSVDRKLLITLVGLSLVLTAFAWMMPYPIPTSLLILLWGVASFALVPLLQVRVMKAASDAPQPGLCGEYRGLQSRKCHWRGAWRRRDRCRLRPSCRRLGGGRDGRSGMGGSMVCRSRRRAALRGM